MTKLLKDVESRLGFSNNFTSTHRIDTESSRSSGFSSSDT